MEENNKLIPIANNSLVQKATISLAITNKLIAENNKQLVIEIFRKNPKLFLDLICRYYPLNFELLKKLDSKYTIIEIKSCDEDDFDFDYVYNTKNKIDYYRDFENKNLKEGDKILCIINKYLSQNKNTLDFITKLNEFDFLEEIERLSFYNRISWYSIGLNENIIWNEEIITEFDGDFYWDVLSSNKNLQLSIEFIKNFKDKWD